MKNTLLPTLALLCVSAAATAQSSNVSEMYIVPVDAQGNTSFDGTDYTDKIPMTENEDGTFSVSSCSLDYGFYFLGNSDTNGTLYTLNLWAVNPPVEIGPNPLSITQSSLKQYIKVQKGTYDITFIPTNVNDTGSRLFTISNSDGSITYPDTIYLTRGTSASQCEAIEGKNGVYTYDVTDDIASFRISYEPRNDYSSFIYGIADNSAQALTVDEKTSLSLGKITDFNVDYNEARSNGTTGNEPLILTISLVKGDEYALLHKQIISSVNTIDSENIPTQYYTLSGTLLPTTSKSQLPTGIYIVKNGNKVSKQIVH